jgi:hypothetical protein
LRGRILVATIIILTLALIHSGRADVISSHVVINEFESNPPSGGSQYVELYNPTPAEIDIGGWIIRAVRGGQSYDISIGTLLPPGSFWQTTLPGQFIHKDGDMLLLMNAERVVVDQTPMLSDAATPGDAMTWQRTPDAGTDWRFFEGTQGQTNSQTTATTTTTEEATTTTSSEEATTTTMTSEEQTTTTTSEEQTTTTTTQQQTTTTTTEQTTTSTTYQQTMTSTTQQQATTQTGPAESFGIGFAFAVIGIGAGAAGAAGGLAAFSSGERYPEVFAYAGYYYCRRHRVPVWLVQGGLWCPIERKFLRP